MIDRLEKHHKLNQTLLLLILGFVCLSLLLFRFIYSQSDAFWFLNWNLFLASIPWVVTSTIVVFPNQFQHNKLLLIITLGFWLLFFPNAPYIITDLIHLFTGYSNYFWFDLILILIYAWTGLLFAFFSLWDLEKIAEGHISKTSISIISSILLFIGSFGVYLGRELRWNSWDILTTPLNLLFDITNRISNPIGHQETWGMTIFFGIFLNIIYWSLKVIRESGVEKAS